MIRPLRPLPTGLACILLTLVLSACGSAPKSRPASPDNLSSIVQIQSSSIPEDRSIWSLNAAISSDTPIVKATVFYKPADSSGSFNTETLSNKNGLEKITLKKPTNGSGHLLFYMALEDAEGRTRYHGLKTNPLAVKAPGMPEQWYYYVKKHAKLQYGPGNWQFGCSGKPFREKFVVKDNTVIFEWDGENYSSELSSSGAFKVEVPLKRRAKTSSQSDSTIARDKRTLIYKGSLRSGKGRFTVGIQEFGNRGCTAKSFLEKIG